MCEEGREKVKWEVESNMIYNICKWNLKMPKMRASGTKQNVVSRRELYFIRGGRGRGIYYTKIYEDFVFYCLTSFSLLLSDPDGLSGRWRIGLRGKPV
jgi:hypothetical protein